MPPFRHSKLLPLPRGFDQLIGSDATIPSAQWMAMIPMLLLALVVLCGCSAPKTSDRDLSYVDVGEARGLIDSTGSGWLRRSTRAAWVDPRSEREFNEGHIPGAVHLPLDRARDDHRSLRDYTTLIVYGNDFNSPRANAMSKLLIELGHGDVRTLRGGLRAWNAAGYTVDRK